MIAQHIAEHKLGHPLETIQGAVTGITLHQVQGKAGFIGMNLIMAGIVFDVRFIEFHQIGGIHHAGSIRRVVTHAEYIPRVVAHLTDPRFSPVSVHQDQLPVRGIGFNIVRKVNVLWLVPHQQWIMDTVNIEPGITEAGKIQPAVVTGHVQVLNTGQDIGHCPLFAGIQIHHVDIVYAGAVTGVIKVGTSMGEDREVFSVGFVSDQTEIGTVPINHVDTQSAEIKLFQREIGRHGRERFIQDRVHSDLEIEGNAIPVKSVRRVMAAIRSESQVVTIGRPYRVECAENVLGEVGNFPRLQIQ